MEDASWIKYSADNIGIGTKGKIYKWRDHKLYGVMENAITSVDVNIVPPETCIFDLQFSYMHPKQLMCGKLEGTNTTFFEVISLYNINIQ